MLYVPEGTPSYFAKKYSVNTVYFTESDANSTLPRLINLWWNTEKVYFPNRMNQTIQYNAFIMYITIIIIIIIIIWCVTRGFPSVYCTGDETQSVRVCVSLLIIDTRVTLFAAAGRNRSSSTVLESNRIGPRVHRRSITR